MSHTYSFLEHVLDAITEHIVVIDATGLIQFVNQSWLNFGDDNACTIENDWHGINYLAECDKAAAMGDEFGLEASKGIRQVIEQVKAEFYFEYPCHSPIEKRWFMMRVTPFYLDDEPQPYFVISHQNITERKLAEEAVIQLARIDGLTDIPNRRRFDEFIHEQWMRCMRLHQPICLAMIDIDDFKLLNDHYGHQVGDDCLIKVGALLKQWANRPDDLCARYGGEEFVLVWANTSLREAKRFADELLSAIYALQIPNETSTTNPIMTVSIGVAEMIPSKKYDESKLIERADMAMYDAKKAGKNQVLCAEK